MAIRRGMSGLDQLQRNLNRQVAAIERRSRAGMHRAVNIVVGQAKVYTPVDTSNLINSAGTDVVAEVNSITGIIFYTAAYAVFVHEINRNYSAPRKRRRGRRPDGRFRWVMTNSKPTAQWKFLETALREKAHDVIEVLADSARIPPGPSR